jgi:hypothetical protein
VTELNGDAGEDATAQLVRADTNELLASAPVHVAAGGSDTVAFPVTLTGSGPVGLRVDVVDPSVAEVTADDNSGSAEVEVTEFRVDAGDTILQTLAG